MIKRTAKEIIESNFECTIEDMVGRTFSKVKNIDNYELVFESTDGLTFTFYHSQDCCECVIIEDICGELKDLKHTALLQAEESTNYNTNSNSESSTWTFYRFATIKGSVVIRWLGESNGFYSESVYLKVESTN